MSVVGHLVLILVATATVLGMVEARVGNCSQPLSTPIVLVAPSGQTVLTTFGTYGLIQSAVDGQIFPESFTIKLDFLGIAERNKTYPARSCSTPTGIGTTPFSVYQGQGFAAPVLNFHNASEFDCYPYLGTNYVNGVEIRGLYLQYSRDDLPDTTLLFSYEFSESDVEVSVTNDTTYTHGALYSFLWPANRLKITTNMMNFPWSQPLSSSNLTTQFVSAHFEIGMTLVAGGTGYFEDLIRSTRMRYNTSTQSMDFEFEKAYFVDGVAFDNDQSYAGDPFYIAPDNDIPLTSHIGIGICHDHFGQWKQAIYDPQLSSVFLHPPSPEEVPAQSPTTNKNNRIVQIVAPIVVVVVVALVVAAIVTVILNPSLKAKFMPSLSKDAHLSTTSTRGTGATATPTNTTPSPTRATAPVASPAEPPANNGWTRSERPTI